MTLDISQMPFSDSLGIHVSEATVERVTATLTVRDDLCTTGRIMHGGALMALADTLGAIGAYLNLPDEAAATTTIESKTNFLRAAEAGTTITAETLPINVGRRLSVWQTTISRDDGKPIAVVTQTQLVL